jgi:hypothetical protein
MGSARLAAAPRPSPRDALPTGTQGAARVLGSRSLSPMLQACVTTPGFRPCRMPIVRRVASNTDCDATARSGEGITKRRRRVGLDGSRRRARFPGALAGNLERDRRGRRVELAGTDVARQALEGRLAEVGSAARDRDRLIDDCGAV